MKHSLKRGLCLALVLMLILSVSVPAFAASADPTWCHTGTAIVYLSAPAGKKSTINIDLAESTRGLFDLYRKDITILGNSDVRLVAIRGTANAERAEWLSTSGWQNSTAIRCRYTATVSATKPGKAVLYYRINGRQYSLKLDIREYQNPIKTITVTGVNSNTNFAKLTKKYHKNVTLDLPATTRSAKLNVEPISGWRVTRLEIYDRNTGEMRIRSSKNGWTSAVALSLGTLRINHNYDICVVLWNPSVGFTSTYCYYLHGASAS